MTPRLPRGRRPDQPLVDLASVFADDELLDSLAGGHRADGQGAVGAADPVPDLFRSWQSELSARPLPAPPSTRAAAAALSVVVDPKPTRALRPVLAASVAIVALLLGSAVLFTRTATENSPLWGIASVIWQDRADSVQARNDAKEAIEQARAALEAGSPELAEAKLSEAQVMLDQVSDVDNPDDVEALWKTLKDQSEDDQQEQAASSSSSSLSPSSRSASVPSAPTGPRTTRSSPTPIIQVPSEEPAGPAQSAQQPVQDAPQPEVPSVEPAPVVPRVAPSTTADPFLLIADPTSSNEVVTPPLLPPAEPEEPTDPPVEPVVPVEPVLPVEPTPVEPTPMDPTVPVEATPVEPAPVEPTPTDPATPTETPSTPSTPAEVAPVEEPGTGTSTTTTTSTPEADGPRTVDPAGDQPATAGEPASVPVG